jgi:Leucine-rich repeat (LRR) protein
MRHIALLLLACVAGYAAEPETDKSKTNKTEKVEVSIFPDKKLEAAVRKFVFDKRDNDKPITEADVANLSTIQGVGMGIKDLTGLEKCRSLASLDLAKNSITDIGPLKELTSIQYLNLANNQISDVSPLAKIVALQYIELSNNQVKDLSPLSGLTNMASLYLSNNQVSDISPVAGFRRLSSLYLDKNKLSSVKGVENFKWLSSLSLNDNQLTDVTPIAALNSLYFLFLERNKIKDITPLFEAAKKDSEGEKRFSPYINIFISGNPLSSAAKRQLSEMKEFGCRINN